MAWFGVILSLAGAGVSAAGQAKAGRRAKRAFGVNAAIEEQNAVRAIEAADEDIKDIEEQEFRVLGAQRAGYGAAGVAASSGSALDVLADTVRRATLDQNRRKYAGELQAETHRNNARAGIASGKAAVESSGYGAAATLLQGVGNFASSGGFSSKTYPTYLGGRAP